MGGRKGAAMNITSKSGSTLDPRPTGKAPAEPKLSMRAALEARNHLETTLEILRTGPEGLVEAEATRRFAKDGPNEVAHDKPPHWTLQLLAAFKNPFILVLVALALIQYVSDPEDLKPVIIVAVMVGLSVGLRFWQEFRSARAAERLKSMVRTTATVLRRSRYGAKPERA